MNKRQREYRIKNGLCWDCNIPLVPSINIDAGECPKCGQIYLSFLMIQYLYRVLNKI